MHLLSFPCNTVYHCLSATLLVTKIQDHLSAPVSTFNTNDCTTLPTTPQALSPPHQALPLLYHHGSMPESSQGLSFCISDTYASFPSTLLPPLSPRTTTSSSSIHTCFPAGPLPPLSYSTMVYPSTSFPIGPIPSLHPLPSMSSSLPPPHSSAPY